MTNVADELDVIGPLGNDSCGIGSEESRECGNVGAKRENFRESRPGCERGEAVLRFFVDASMRADTWKYADNE